jgi:predicted aspartyl protease
MNRLTGDITDNQPTVRAVVKNGALVFSPRGDFKFIVDTGFTGDLLIPQLLVKKLNLELIAYNTFQLATEQLVTLPVYRGNVVIGKAALEVEMVPGDALIGMALMQRIGSQLTLNFKTRTVVLKG